MLAAHGGGRNHLLENNDELEVSLPCFGVDFGDECECVCTGVFVVYVGGGNVLQ